MSETIGVGEGSVERVEQLADTGHERAPLDCWH